MPNSVVAATEPRTLVAVPSPEAARSRYTQAVALSEAVRKDLRAIDKGPYARPSSIDQLLQSGGIVTEGGAVLAGALAFLSGITTSALASSGGAIAIGTAVAVGSGLTSYFLGYTKKRAARTIESKKLLPIGHAELERMLAKWTTATPEERAILRPVIETELLAFDMNLSPKAAIMRERLLAELPSLDPDTVEGRASKTALAVNNLLNHCSFDAQLNLIEHALHAASPTERREAAKVLENALFEGEQSRFTATAEQQRALFRAIAHAYHGESPKQPLGKSQS